MMEKFIIFLFISIKQHFKHRLKEYFKLSTDHATRENPSNFHQIWREMKNRTVSAPMKILYMSQNRLCVVKYQISQILRFITSMIYKWVPECNKLSVCEGCPSIQASLWWRGGGTARKLLQIEHLRQLQKKV